MERIAVTMMQAFSTKKMTIRLPLQGAYKGRCRLTPQLESFPVKDPLNQIRQPSSMEDLAITRVLSRRSSMKIPRSRKNAFSPRKSSRSLMLENVYPVRPINSSQKLYLLHNSSKRAKSI